MNPVDSSQRESSEKAHSSGWMPETSSEVEKDQPLSLVKRKEKRVTNPEEWEKFSMKRLRMEGKTYSGRKLIANGVSVKAVRPERKMGPMCNSKKCASSEFKKKCTTFTFEERKSIHTRFWRDLNWDEKKMFVIAHVKVNKKEAAERGKRVHPLYYLTSSNGERLEVCKQMFVNTLSIGKKAIINWTENSEHGIPAAKKLSKVKQYEDKFKILKFFATLPRQPQSGRKVSSKITIHESYRNLLHVYNSYIDYCQERNITPASRVTVCRKFHACDLHLSPEYKDFDFASENTPESNIEFINSRQETEDVQTDIQLNPLCMSASTQQSCKQSVEVNSCTVPCPVAARIPFPKLSAALNPPSIPARTKQFSKQSGDLNTSHVPAWKKLFSKQSDDLKPSLLPARTKQISKHSAESNPTHVPSLTKLFSKQSAVSNPPHVSSTTPQLPNESAESNSCHVAAANQPFSKSSAVSNHPRVSARKQHVPKQSPRIVVEWPYHYLSALTSTRPFATGHEADSHGNTC